MTHDMKLINNVLKTSIKIYLFLFQMNSSIRNNVKFLIARYQQSNKQVFEQIFDQYQILQHLPTKQKIEKWIVDWKTLYQEIVNKNLIDLYENESIFVNKFFKTEKKWTFNFCESWIRILKNSSRFVKFYETIKKYHIAVETHIDKIKKSFRKINMINVVIFQN